MILHLKALFEYALWPAVFDGTVRYGTGTIKGNTTPSTALSSSSSIDISAASRLCTTAWERITKNENIIIVGEIHAIIEYSTMTGVGLYQIPIMWKYVIIVESTR